MKQIIFIILLFAVFSCNSKKSNETISSKSDKENLISELTEKYNAAFSFDTISNKTYSIDFNDLIESNFQIINGFLINDIYENEDEKHIIIQSFASFQEFYFDLKVSDSILQRIRESSTDYNFHFESILVIKTDYVKKIDFIIEGTSIEYSVDLGISNNLYGPFYCTGSLIEFKKVKKDE